MANLFLRREANSGQTVESYLSELSHHLKHHLPPQEASEILDETEAHLRERVEEDTQSTAADATALRHREREALVGFGHPAMFARSASRSLYETTASRQARCLGEAVTVSAFLLSCTAAVNNFAIQNPAILTLNLLALFAIAVVLPACAFLSRRSHTRAILSCGIMLLAVSICAAGYYKTTLPNGHWIDRRQLAANIRHAESELDENRAESRLLESGEVFWRYHHRPALYAALHSNGEYVVPVKPLWDQYGPQWRSLLQNRSAFRPLDNMSMDGNGRYEIRYRGTAYETVTSETEARDRWLNYGHRWLIMRRSQVTRLEKELSEYRLMPDSLPKHFVSGFVWWDDLWSIPFTAGILAINELAAWLGRKSFLRRRRKTRRAAA